jgi:hypothetical protein
MPADRLSLAIDPSGLDDLIRRVVEATVAQLEAAKAKLPEERLAFSEPEAARMLGLLPHQLRDERHRGAISASIVVGRRVRYRREDLVQYLMARRSEAQEIRLAK